MNSKQINIASYARDPLLRNSLFIAITRIFDAGGSFLFWMIAARLYTIENVGLATALISSLGLIIAFSGLGFTITIIRFFPTNDKAKVFGTAVIVTTVASILMCATYIMLVESLAHPLIFLKVPGYALIFLIIGAANSVQTLTGIAFIADRKTGSFLFQHILLALKIPLLIPLTTFGAFGIFGSMGIAILFASLFGMIVIQRSIPTIRPAVNMEFLRSSFRFSSWNYASNMLTIAPTMILPIMILNMLGEAETAKYYIAFAIGNIVGIIPQSLATSLFVEGSHGEGLKNSVIRSGVVSVVLLVPSVLIIFHFGDILLGLLRGEYLEAFALLRLIVLSSLLQTIHTFFISIQRVKMRIECLVTLDAIRCVLLLGLSYTFIKQCGIIGIGYGWIATYGIIALVIGWIAKQERWI